MSRGTKLPPHVTGISPNQGTPGTMLTIRGSNFGDCAEDVTHVFINQIDVGPTRQWFSSSHIKAITPLGEGELEIIVVTNNKNFGTSSVSYSQTAKRSVGPQTSVTYWPADERRHCPAIYEHAHEGGRDGTSGAAGMGTGELDPSTGLPMSERSRISIPISDAELQNIYPVSGSVQLTDKDFDPMLFLLKFYKNSSFNDLTVTFNNFRRSLQSDGPSEPVNVIRTNLVLIFRCLVGMESLMVKLLSEKKVGGKNQYELPLESTLGEARTLGHQLFENILKRRDRAESTRNAIGVLQRYHFLFNLPHAIRTNISKGDYNLVLNDYLRAKSLFGYTDISVLSRVYEDVESVISKFRALLREQLTTMPIEFGEAKRKIGYLLQLEVDFDPTYECLHQFKEWLVVRAHLYQQTHRQSLGTKPTSMENSTAPVSRPKSRLSKQPASPRVVAQNVTNWTDTDDVHPTVGLVKSICDLMVQHVVPFWRIGTAYTSGQLSSGASLLQPGRSVGTVPPQRESLMFQRNFQNDPKSIWTQMNSDLVHVLTNTIRDEVLEVVGSGFKNTTVVDWLPQCIEEFRRCCIALPLGELPKEIGEIFSGLAHDLRRHVVRGVFHHAQISIETLQLRETWDVDLNDTRGAITKLPEMYEKIMSDALDQCRDQVLPQTSVERPLFNSAELQERFPDWCGDAMVSLIATLRRLADQIESTVSRGDMIDGRDESADFVDINVIRPPIQTSITPQARGLLLLLNNAQLVSGSANERLLMSYKFARYAFPDRLRKRLEISWKSAIDDLISRYVKVRAPWLFGPINLLFTGLPVRMPCDADKAPPITGAHTTVRYVLGNLSLIYSELVLLLGTQTVLQVRSRRHDSRNLIQTILTQIITLLVDHIHHHCNSSAINIPQLPRVDQLQLWLDFNLIRTVIPKPLFTEETYNCLEHLCTVLRSGSTEASQDNEDLSEQRLLDGLMENEKSRISLLLNAMYTLDLTGGSVILIRS